MATPVIWRNNDGLAVKFGRDEAFRGAGGEFSIGGEFRVVELDIVWNQLNAFGTVTILDETVKLPNGCLLTNAEIEVVVPFAGATATLALGLAKTDGTAYDATGISTALAQTALDTVGETTNLTGALVNTILANTTPSLISATVGTANFTAGRAKLRLKYFFPTPAPSIV